jgi:hypothetical protein
MSYEMGLSTANELHARFVRLVMPFFSLAGELYSRHYPAPKSSKDNSNGPRPRGHTESSATLAIRWTNLDSSRNLVVSSPHLPTFPLELVSFCTLGQHYGASAAVEMMDRRLGIAGSWKRKWNSPVQKFALGMRLKFDLLEIPSMIKVTASSHSGIAAFFGVRLQECLGIGIGTSLNHNTSQFKAALFFDL